MQPLHTEPSTPNALYLPLALCSLHVYCEYYSVTLCIIHLFFMHIMLPSPVGIYTPQKQGSLSLLFIDMSNQYLLNEWIVVAFHGEMLSV